VSRAAVVLLAATVLGSCKGGESDCSPTDAACAAANVASIVVSSPIDSILVLGSTTQLEAEPRDAGGSVLSATVTWSSSDQTVANVSGSGLVNGLVVGEALMTATVGATSTSYPMRVVDADLPAFTAVLGDPFLTALSGALGGSVATALSAVVDQCEDAVLEAYVLAAEACLNDAVGLSSANGNDEALLGVLDLFFDYSRGFLDLGR
jgi:hypothetical protein